MKKAVPVLAILLVASGCSLFDQFRQLRAFARCQFRLVSVEQVELAGIRIDGKKSVREFSVMDGVKLASATTGKSLPLNFILNIEVKNPNAELAAMNKLAWILLVDGLEMTRGEAGQRVDVAPNGSAPLPIGVSVDLREVLSGQSLDAMINLAFNMAGEGSHPTRITLKAKPSILVGGQPVDFPDFITVNTEYGGGEVRQ